MTPVFEKTMRSISGTQYYVQINKTDHEQYQIYFNFHFEKSADTLEDAYRFILDFLGR